MTDPKKQRRLWYIIGSVLILAFVAFGATSFKSNLTPYVTFEEAMAKPGKVQIAGKLVEASTHFVEESQKLSFGLMDDEGTAIAVLYEGTKPGNFEDATQIVAVGSYHDEAFHAEQLLVKCPSKYEGVDEDVSKHSSET